MGAQERSRGLLSTTQQSVAESGFELQGDRDAGLPRAAGEGNVDGAPERAGGR